jgi:hypothetical protein
LEIQLSSASCTAKHFQSIVIGSSASIRSQVTQANRISMGRPPSGSKCCSQAFCDSRLENPVGSSWYQREPAAAQRTTTGTNYSLHPLGKSPLFRLVPSRESMQPAARRTSHWLVPTTACIHSLGNPLCSGWYQARACSRSENHWYQPTTACIRLGNPLCSGWYQARACSRSENHWY